MSGASQLLRLPAEEAVRRLILDRARRYERASRAAREDALCELELTLTHLASRFCACALVGQKLDARGVKAAAEAARVYPVDLLAREAGPSFGAVMAGILRALAAGALQEHEREPAAGGSWATLANFAALGAENAREALLAVAPTDTASAEHARRVVEELARSFEAESEVETERKYLLHALPPRAREGARAHLTQGYVPGARLHERLRRVEREGETYFLRTIKLGSGLSRVEVEEETSPQLFDRFWPLTAGRRLEKIRYELEDGGYVWAIDEFLDRPLVLAEVELPNAQLSPAIPGWLSPYLVRDVTHEPAYVNANLAT